MYRIGENPSEGLSPKAKRPASIKAIQDSAPHYEEIEAQDNNSPQIRIRQTSQRHPRQNRGTSLPLISKTERDEANNSKIAEKRLPSLTLRVKKPEDDNKSLTNRGLNESGATLGEIKRILDQSGKRKGASVTNKAEMRRVLIDDDYESVGPQINRGEDREDVKSLERWRMEIKRKKIMNSVDKMSEIMESFRQKKAQENGHDPIVNVDALNRILVESEEENSDDEGGINPSAFNNKKGAFNLNDDRFLKGIEIAILENNQELVNSFVMRKVQSQIETIQKKSLSPQQLRLQIKMIVEGAMHKFKTLKKYISDLFIQNQADMILQKLRINQSKNTKIFNDEEEETTATQIPEVDTDKTIVDYPMIESALVRSYHQAINDSRNLAARKSRLNNETFKLKKEIAHIQQQLQQLALKEKAYFESKADTSMDGRRRAAVVDLEGTPDFMAIQKARLERKKQEAFLQEKLSGLQQRLTPVSREIDTVEADLKMTRDTKAYFKMQLKDLYYKILKDEKYLMRNKNNASSTWIIKSLWNIHEEIKDQAFPTFLDKHSIRFMTDYSKVQLEIEKYCIQNNILGMLSGIDDFKNALAGSQSREKSDPENKDFAEEPTPRVFCEKTKTTSLLLEEFRDKMMSMKKVNLRAKRLVNVVQFTAKGRAIVPKWEEVNPLLTNDEIINQFINRDFKEAATELEVSNAEPDRIKLIKPEAPIIIDPTNPTNIVATMLNDLETMKKNEINRIIKDHVGITLDDRLKFNLEKTFVFMLGRIQGPEAFKRFLKEKKDFDDKSMKSNQTHKRAHSNQIGTHASKMLQSLMTVQVEKLVSEEKSEDGKPESVRPEIAKPYDLPRSGSVPKLPSLTKSLFAEKSPTFAGNSTINLRNESLNQSQQANIISSRILLKKSSKMF